MISYHRPQEHLFHPVGKKENQRNNSQVSLLLLWAIFMSNFPGPLTTMTNHTEMNIRKWSQTLENIIRYWCSKRLCSKKKIMLSFSISVFFGLGKLLDSIPKFIHAQVWWLNCWVASMPQAFVFWTPMMHEQLFLKFHGLSKSWCFFVIITVSSLACYLCSLCLVLTFPSFYSLHKFYILVKPKNPEECH